jgi:ABC-type uncharacterized transport system permease subunit
VFDQAIAWDNPVVTASNAQLACLKPRDGSDRPWILAAKDTSDGKPLWSQPLPAEPVRWAIAVDAQGRVVVALRNGQVLCFGG